MMSDVVSQLNCAREIDRELRAFEFPVPDLTFFGAIQLNKGLSLCARRLRR
jgi:hypothetical protein